MKFRTCVYEMKAFSILQWFSFKTFQSTHLPPIKPLPRNRCTTSVLLTFQFQCSAPCLCWDHQPPSTATKSKQNASLNVFNEKFSHRAFAQQRRRPRRLRREGAWCSGCGWLCLSFLCNFCLMLVLLLIRKLLHLFEMFSLAN